MYKATTTIPRIDSRIELKKPGLVDPALYETNVCHTLAMNLTRWGCHSEFRYIAMKVIARAIYIAVMEYRTSLENFEDNCSALSAMRYCPSLLGYGKELISISRV
jgi:hypothetical protein